MASAVTTMLAADQEIAPPLGAISKKKHLLSAAMMRTNEWISSQEIPSDIIVQAGGSSFSLHKFPLASKCGYIRKLISESKESSISIIEIPDIPGGSEAFELAVKFCYGIKCEINTDNVAMLRCAAEYLEMTEDYAVGNLISRTEAYLEEIVLMSLPVAVTVLHKSENLLPIAEKVKLVSRCVDAVAYVACNDSQVCLSLKSESSRESSSFSSLQPKAIVGWWAEELTVLRIDTFQKVLMAMKARGFKQYDLGPALMLYAQKSLRGLDIFGRGRKKIDPKQEHEKRVVLETIVSLLPRDKNAISVSFLSMLLRASIYLETTVACRLDLEKRMGLQLGQAVLDDLLIPSFSFDGDTMFDIDTIQRILMNYIEHEVDGSHLGYKTEDDHVPPPLGDMERVGRLMESYLSEVASDSNLAISKFTSIAEIIPEQAKVTEDGMYRAIDIFLKARPSLIDAERKKICSLMDCQKLSREACAHAAQNDRLPIQTVVQVLYYEQQRIRDAMDGSFMGGDSPSLPHKQRSYDSGYHSPSDELSRLRRENDFLKLELMRVRMQLKDMQKASGNAISSEKPPLPRKSFMNSVSKRLGRLSLFAPSDNVNPFSGKAKVKPAKDRRHSIS